VAKKQRNLYSVCQSKMYKHKSMKQLSPICIIAVILSITNCKKESLPVSDCAANDATIRQINNQPATVKLLDGQRYLIEQGAIDSRLKACNLPDSLAIQDLPVIVSGAVKATVQQPGTPCCTDNFVITAIRR
jgi:hypothetical protein